jgi:hypothetical protein
MLKGTSLSFALRVLKKCSRNLNPSMIGGIIFDDHLLGPK